MKKLASIALVKSADNIWDSIVDTTGYETPDWLNTADVLVKKFKPERFVRNTLGFKNYRNPGWVDNSWRWFKNLSPEAKAGLGVGVPLAGLALESLLFGRDKQASSREEETSHDILDTRLRTIPADLIYPWASNRAGRAFALADLTGQRTPTRLRYPNSMLTLDSLLGGVLGGAVGSLAGYRKGYLKKDERLIGALLGAWSGSLGGALLNTFLRRKGMKDIKQLENQDGGTPAVTIPKYSPLDTALLPLSGPHRLGYSEILEDVLAKGEPSSRKGRHLGNLGLLGSTSAANALAAGSGLVPWGNLLHIPYGIGSNILAQNRIGKVLEGFDNSNG